MKVKTCLTTVFPLLQGLWVYSGLLRALRSNSLGLFRLTFRIDVLTDQRKYLLLLHSHCLLSNSNSNNKTPSSHFYYMKMLSNHLHPEPPKSAMPPRRPLPDLCILAIFNQLPPNSLLRASMARSLVRAAAAAAAADHPSHLKVKNSI